MTTPTEAADLVGISRDSVKRWLETYTIHFSPGATPPPGNERVLNPLDLRILLFIKSLRESGLRHEAIAERLHEANEANWVDLPMLPEDLGTVSVMRAAEMVGVEVLKRDLAYTRQQLDLAQARVRDLEADLEQVRADRARLETERDTIQHTLELEIERQRAEVEHQKNELAQLEVRLRTEAAARERDLSAAHALLQGQLKQYQFWKETPINVGVIILITAAVVAVLVVAIFALAGVLLR